MAGEAYDGGINDFDDFHVTVERVFETIEATDEVVIDRAVANETLVGSDGIKALALPHEPLLDLLRRFGRLDPPA